MCPRSYRKDEIFSHRLLGFHLSDSYEKKALECQHQLFIPNQPFCLKGKLDVKGRAILNRVDEVEVS